MSAQDARSMAAARDGAPLPPAMSAPRGGINYTPTTELSATFTARGVHAEGVMADARRIAAQVFPGLDLWLSYGDLTPGLSQIDGTGQTTVNHWQAEVTARATVPGA